jgi:plastocyanin
MERGWIIRLAVVIGAATLIAGTAACANDSNTHSEVNPHANIVNAAESAADTTIATPVTSGGDEAAAERFEIEIANFQFSPADAVVVAGTEVVWLNDDTDMHSIVSTGDLFASSDVFENGESYAVVFAEPGTYAYTCGVHPFMAGSIKVE